MLLLERSSGEYIDITCPNGDLIQVKIRKINGGQVFLGIDAPKQYLIDRREVTIRKANQVPQRILTLKKEPNGNV
jgi:carbon storage regulator CsrA